MEGVGLGIRAASRSLDAALGAIAILVLGFGLVEVALIVAAPGGGLPALMMPVLAWVYGAAGLLAWRRRPNNRLGLLLVLGSVSWLGAGLASTAVRPLDAAGLVLATAPLAVVVHLVHAFPSGVLRGISRPIVLAGYVVALAMQAPLYLYGTAPAPYDVFTIAHRPDLVGVDKWVQGTCGALVMVATTVVLIGRLRAVDPSRRRVLAPLLGYGVVAVLMVPVSSHVLGPLLHLDDTGIGTIQTLTLAGIPVAFALGLLRGGFGRTGQLEELGAWLGSGPGSRPDLTRALAETLGDPTLELWFWVPDRGQYVDGEGAAVDPKPSGTGRGLDEVELGGERIGAIVYDQSLLADAAFVHSAGRVVALALERERLTAELRAARTALQDTLTRVIEAADRERRRIARDLHDGLQSRLVLLGVSAQRIETDPSASDSVTSSARRLREGLDEGAHEVRRLVHGVLPAALIERGLFAATKEFLAQLPIPATAELSGGDARLPATVETAAYFVLTEAVTNALKHAGAAELRVSMQRRHDRLLITVCDDGVGGAAGTGDSGLTGLADRVTALGGWIELDSPVGRGTRLLAEMPCASS